MSELSELQYKSIRARVYRWAFRLLQNEHDALDATQNVLLKALRVPPAELDPMAAGLVVLVSGQDGELVFANIAGDIDLAAIAKLGPRLDIPGLELLDDEDDDEDDDDD